MTSLHNLAAAQFPQEHKPDWFESYTGCQIYPTEPERSPVNIEDIGHALAHVCRYAGHCRFFYSVAAHSLFVYMLVKAHTDDINTLKYALMHDAAEAYIHDITRPMKVSPGMEWYKELESRWEAHIASQCGIDMSSVDRQLVKEADNHALRFEAAKLVRSGGRNWAIPATRDFPCVIVQAFHAPRDHAQERDMFIRTWRELNGRH